MRCIRTDTGCFFKKIEERLNSKTKVHTRKDVNEDFPLRGAVVCGRCDTWLTACWSKGRGTHYPYYLCRKRGCDSYGKSVRRDVIEGEFEALLHSLKPTPGLFTVARKMLENLWSHRLATSEARVKNLKTELAKTATPDQTISQPDFGHRD